MQSFDEKFDTFQQLMNATTKALDGELHELPRKAVYQAIRNALITAGFDQKPEKRTRDLTGYNWFIKEKSIELEENGELKEQQKRVNKIRALWKTLTTKKMKGSEHVQNLAEMESMIDLEHQMPFNRNKSNVEILQSAIAEPKVHVRHLTKVASYWKALTSQKKTEWKSRAGDHTASIIMTKMGKVMKEKKERDMELEEMRRENERKLEVERNKMEEMRRENEMKLQRMRDEMAEMEKEMARKMEIAREMVNLQSRSLPTITRKDRGHVRIIQK